MTLKVPPRDDRQYDAISLGEVMLRLDPGAGRVRTARSFTASEGGGEYNVARGLRKAFGLRTAIVTALADNDVGRLVEDLICQGGVDTQLVQWLPYDGIGRTARNGLNFTERGFGVRVAVGVSDRGHTAVSALKPGDLDWDAIFGHLGTRWFHTGGIFASLSETTAEVALEAVQAAKRHGVVTSYDLNSRPSLWKSVGGQAKAQEVNRAIAPFIDVMIGNEEDFTASLGFTVTGLGDAHDHLEVNAFATMIDDARKVYPNFAVIATTLRAVRSATLNDWGAVARSEDSGLVEATHRPALEIYDRVGGGDSFASGLIFGLMSGRSLVDSVELGAAHGALAMTTPGDTSMASLKEVEALAAGGSARVQR